MCKKLHYKRQKSIYGKYGYKKQNDGITLVYALKVVNPIRSKSLEPSFYKIWPFESF